MLRYGCGLAILGVLLFAGSLALFGVSILRGTQAREVADVSLELGESTTTAPIRVETDRLAQVTVRGTVRGDSVQEKREFDETEYELRFSFPVSYSVLDSNGAVIHSQRTTVAWNSGSRTYSGWQVTSAGGYVHAEYWFEKFQVPPPGEIRVEVRLDPDSRYGATIEEPTLRVYDRVSRHSGRVFGGLALFLLGPAIALVGCILFIVGMMRRSASRATPAD